MMKIIAYVLLLVTFTVGQVHKQYEGHKIVEVNAATKHQLETISHLQLDNDIDFWTEPSALHVPISIRIPPKKYEDVTQLFKQNNIDFRVTRENVQEGVDKEMARLAERFRDPEQQAFNLADWNTYDDTMQWLETLKGQCASGVTCRTYSIGQSVEGRDLKVFNISSGSGKKAFWIDANIHAREWLSPATVNNILNKFVTEYNTDADVKRLVDTYDWYFISCMNPDGYIWSWTGERFWRKSRNVNPGSDCMGTDLNRNYDVNWMNDGTSTDPCSDIYGGESAASAPETQAVQNELKRLGSNIRAFMTVHTAALMWLHPMGSTDASGQCAISPDNDDMTRVARAAGDAAEAAEGQYWQAGTSCQVLSPASGGTDDYAHVQAGIKYSYTPELRGPGFDPPNSEIAPSVRENWAAIKAVVDEITAIEGAP